MRIDFKRSNLKPGFWLLTLDPGIESVVSGNWFPQAYAVTDDFGNLVIVSAWR